MAVCGKKEKKKKEARCGARHDTHPICKMRLESKKYGASSRRGRDMIKTVIMMG